MTTTILCFGDSNTHGTKPLPAQDVVDRHGPETRWPGVLAKALGVGFRVIEEGLPGRTTVHDDPIEGAHMNGLAALPMVVGSHSPFDLFILMLGTNDLKNRFSVSPADIAASLERLVGNLRFLCNAPGRQQPEVLLIAPPPIQEVDWLADKFIGGAAKSQGLGIAIRRSAERLGVAFLDAGEHIAASPIDGLHYDAETHGTLGQTIANTITNTIKSMRVG